MSVSVQNLSLSKNGAQLVDSASFDLSAGELLVLLGPNGAGKTSLLRAALGIEAPVSGIVTIDGVPLGQLSSAQRARKIAYLPQTRSLAWPSRVRDIVALGRFAYGAGPASLNAEDQRAVTNAMSACDISHLADRRADTLSGGEMARLHFARSLAAGTPYLLADEPVAALDPRHQFRILNLIKQFTENGGGALIILHDISLAARYADRLLWMKGGQITASGSPEDTLTVKRLADVYNVKAEIKGRNIRLLGPCS